MFDLKTCFFLKGISPRAGFRYPPAHGTENRGAPLHAGGRAERWPGNSGPAGSRAHARKAGALPWAVRLGSGRDSSQGLPEVPGHRGKGQGRPHLHAGAWERNPAASAHAALSLYQYKYRNFDSSEGGAPARRGRGRVQAPSWPEPAWGVGISPPGITRGVLWLRRCHVTNTLRFDRIV